MKTVTMITVQELDKLVKETYNKPYSFQQQDGCKDRGMEYLTVPDEANDYKNEAGTEYGVSFQAWLARDPKLPLDGQEYDFELLFWWERNFYPAAQMIANDLHAKGLLPAGEYAIEIDW